ncbi:hypothetical protein LEP1GSC052_2546 [Leptospira kmetyi serovar Malaysia str. Bejo-Iso9]|nr:hypothetical protein LEP1GSC052_2546 [Leptospira kmetyi serovar Malaysia str. Bejo-Iso9]
MKNLSHKNRIDGIFDQVKNESKKRRGSIRSGRPDSGRHADLQKKSFAEF